MERIAESVEGVDHVHDVRARWLGHNITMELHICVAGEQALDAAHALSEQVREELMHHIPRVNDVLIHVDSHENYHHQMKDVEIP